MQVSDWGGNHAEVSLVMRLLTGAEAGSTKTPKHQQQENAQALRNARLTCTSWGRIVSCEREAWAPVTMAFYPHIARLQHSFQSLQVSPFVGAFAYVHASELSGISTRWWLCHLKVIRSSSQALCLLTR